MCCLKLKRTTSLNTKQNTCCVLQFIGLIFFSINFHNPVLSKPANLQNSAVLRMLEEEEQRQRNGFAPSKSKINQRVPCIYHCTIIKHEKNLFPPNIKWIIQYFWNLFRTSPTHRVFTRHYLTARHLRVNPRVCRACAIAPNTRYHNHYSSSV